MKKFVVIMVFVFLMIVLISLNYLLLDNQNKKSSISNLESEAINSSLTISALIKDNDNLLSQNEKLQEDAQEDAQTIETLTGEKEQCYTENETIQKRFEHKLKIIDKIKADIDAALYMNIALEFISYIEDDDSLAAHNLIYTLNGEKTISLEKMKSLFNYEKGKYSINAFEVVLSDDTENILGEIKFKTSLTVSYTKRENNVNSYVTIDVVYFLTYDFDEFDSNWLIKDIEVVFSEKLSTDDLK